MFDFPTLFAVTLFVTVVAGLLLVFSWLQNRRVVALALWGAGFLLSAGAMMLVAGHDWFPDRGTMTVAGTLWIFAHGVKWAAARRFEGRRTPLMWIAAGALAWLTACQSTAFSDSLAARIAVSSTMVGGYLVLCAAEIWRARERELISRWPAIVLLLLHAAVFFWRAAFVDFIPYPGGVLPQQPHWFPLGLFEILFHTFCMSVVLVNMAKERAELRQRRASEVDPLTGIANRRAFFDRGERLLARLAAERRSAAFVILDLDRFKDLNDNFGHQFGDLVLARFCHVTKSLLRPCDLFGRLGGEEFGCLLPDMSFADALRTAEQVRAAVAAAPMVFDAVPVTVTVSAGLATASDADQRLGELFASADRALYRAKARGRNRVESGRAPLKLLEGAPAVATV
jgi:diguanylate cyclase (GGDEF)-like protein